MNSSTHSRLRTDALLARFDSIGMNEWDRKKAKTHYLQAEAAVEQIFSLGARIARGFSGSHAALTGR